MLWLWGLLSCDFEGVTGERFLRENGLDKT